jgi:hypothetical protein
LKKVCMNTSMARKNLQITAQQRLNKQKCLPKPLEIDTFHLT